MTCEHCGASGEPFGTDRKGNPLCEECYSREWKDGLRFTPWARILADAPPDPPWILERYLARGAITLAAGKPKSGKSTLACAIAEAVDAEVPTFLGLELAGGAVVYLSEEGAGTLAPKLSRSTRSVALTREGAHPKPAWGELIAQAVEQAREIGAVLLVIDALAFWAGFAEGAEKDAGAAQAVMDALTAAARAELATLIVHHQRKSGGEEGDAVRGSGAIFGAVDLLLEIERLGEDAPPGHRRIVATGRWPKTPPLLVVDRDAATGSWRVVGEAASRQDAAKLGMRERILDAMPTDPITEAELVEVVGEDKRKVGKPLRELVDEGVVSRTGAGQKGNPYRYEKRCPKKVSRSEDTKRAEKVSSPYREDTFSSSSSSTGPGVQGTKATFPENGHARDQLATDEYVARHRQRFRCTCATPDDLDDRGRCSRCFGWPQVIDHG